MKHISTFGGGPRSRLLPFVLFACAVLALPAFAGQPASEILAMRDRLYDVQFVTDSKVVAVGYPGMVLISEDAGDTWTRIQMDTTDALFSVDFADETHGIAVGRTGLVVSTADGGKTWTAARAETTEPLFCVDMLDAKRGIAVGNFGTIITTTDGATWEFSELEPMINASLNAVAYLDESTIVAAGDYPSWELAMVEDLEASAISNVFRTADGGATWEVVPSGSTAVIYDLAFADDGKTGYAAGSTGELLSTSDGGATWDKIETGEPNHLVGVTIEDGAVWSVGMDGIIVKRAGGTIAKVPSGLYIWLAAVDLNKKGRGVIVGGRGSLLVTEDGGKNWK